MNPLFYGSPSYNSVQINVVEVGTEITDERTGQREVVSENAPLFAGGHMYCTQRTFDQLIAKLKT